MRQKMCFAALCLAMLLTACAPAGPTSPTGRADFDAFTASLDEARRNTPPWTEAEKALFYASLAPSERFDLTEEEQCTLTTPRDPGRAVPVAEARTDVDIFFRALKESYGAYEFFGGDGVFLPARDQVLKRLATRQSVSVEGLAKYLRAALSPVIQDGHFLIGEKDMLVRQSMYYVPDLYFPSGATSLPELERPTIDGNGALAWCLAAVSPDGSALPAQAVVRGETVALHWVPAADLQTETYPAYEERTRSGVPILSCRTLTAGPETQADLAQLAGAGEGWRKEPLFLLDLRGNLGGNDGYAMDWVEGFTGAEPSYKLLHANRLSPLLWAAYPDVAWDGAALELEGAAQNGGPLVFLLQDRMTASSGESFVAAMRSVEHVITVGSNTQGTTMMGNVMTLYLPSTGLSVRFGASLSFCGTAENIEGRGYLPDLWVPPAEAEDAVLRLISYYGLK